MNFERLKAMVKNCSSDYGDECGVKKNTFRRDGNSMILIDVKDMCLMGLRWEERYEVQHITLTGLRLWPEADAQKIKRDLSIPPKTGLYHPHRALSTPPRCHESRPGSLSSISLSGRPLHHPR